jgi:hypothetical protein
MTSSMARASACLLAVLAVLPIAGCKGEDKALPDPTRPPKPTVSSHGESIQQEPPRLERAGVSVTKHATG